MFKGCPGAAQIKGTPELTPKTCPDCGEAIEIFTGDMNVTCKCGFVAYNETQSCIKWCRYAKECVGDDLYEKITKGGQ